MKELSKIRVLDPRILKGGGKRVLSPKPWSTWLLTQALLFLGCWQDVVLGFGQIGLIFRGHQYQQVRHFHFGRLSHDFWYSGQAPSFEGKAHFVTPPPPCEVHRPPIMEHDCSKTRLLIKCLHITFKTNNVSETPNCFYYFYI